MKREIDSFEDRTNSIVPDEIRNNYKRDEIMYILSIYEKRYNENPIGCKITDRQYAYILPVFNEMFVCGQPLSIGDLKAVFATEMAIRIKNNNLFVFMFECFEENGLISSCWKSVCGNKGIFMNKKGNVITTKKIWDIISRYRYNINGSTDYYRSSKDGKPVGYKKIEDLLLFE